MLFFPSLTLCALAVGPVNNEPSVEEVEKAALAQRRAIVRGAVTFSCKGLYNGKPHSMKVRVWFDGKKRRQDLFREDGGKDGIPVREVRGINCECEGCVVVYLQAAPGQQQIMAVLDKLEKVRATVPMVQVEPTRVGFVPVHLFQTWIPNLEQWVGRPDRENVTMKKSTWKGQECWLIEYTLLRGDRVQIWIAPHLGNNVVRMVIEGISLRPKYRWKTTLESTMAQYGPKKVWYPSSVFFENERNGTLNEREELAISDVSLNEPLDPKVFTLAGMDLPEGIWITGSAVKPAGPGKTNVWLQGKIRQIPIPKLAAHPPREAQRTNGWLVLVSVAAACLAAVAVWRLVRTRALGGPS